MYHTAIASVACMIDSFFCLNYVITIKKIVINHEFLTFFKRLVNFPSLSSILTRSSDDSIILLLGVITVFSLFLSLRSFNFSNNLYSSDGISVFLVDCVGFVNNFRFDLIALLLELLEFFELFDLAEGESAGFYLIVFFLYEDS